MKHKEINTKVNILHPFFFQVQLKPDTYPPTFLVSASLVFTIGYFSAGLNSFSKAMGSVGGWNCMRNGLSEALWCFFPDFLSVLTDWLCPGMGCLLAALPWNRPCHSAGRLWATVPQIGF